MLRAGTYSVCFTDLRESTALRVRLGDSAFDELRQRHDVVLVDAVAGSGGTVVKLLGDGILAVFAGAVDALDASVVMQQGIATMNSSAEHPLELSIGIAAGDVAVVEGDVHGTPVVEASRLCGVARPGEILVADMVRLLAGSRANHGFDPRGDLSLKGLPDPVRACAVVWEQLLEPVEIAFCAAEVRALSGAGFVGRVDAREQLERALKRVGTGGSACVLVAGEPGIGKTRLASEVAAEANANGATVLFGACDQDAGVAYQPWSRALTGFAATADSEQLRACVGASGPELVRVAPTLAGRMPEIGHPLTSDPESDRLRLFEAVACFLGALGVDAPVIVLLDDLHWADMPSLLLLRHVMRSSASAGVLLLGTYRDTDLDRTHPLAGVLADLRRSDLIERIPLGGLDRDEVDAFVRIASGSPFHADSQELSGALFAETEGNPFFVGEMVTHLVTSGAVEHDGERWRLSRDLDELGLPEGVREMVGRRLSALSGPANDVLAVSAMVGQRFDAALVAAAMDLPVDAVLDGLDEAVQGRMVLESAELGQFTFAHALVRQTLEAELTVARRARWHRAIGVALENRCRSADVTRLARHFEACATLGEHERAQRYLTAAAERARQALAFEEAAALYVRALDVAELGDDDPLARCDLVTARGEALRLAGDSSYRELLLDAVPLAGNDGSRLAAIVVALNSGETMSTFDGVDLEVLGLCDSALAALGTEDSVDRARILSIIAVELSTAPDLSSGNRGLTAGRAALDMARRLGNRRCLAQVLSSFVVGIHGPDSFEELPAVATELALLADELGDEQLRLAALFAAMWAAFERGEIDQGVQLRDEQHELATRLHYSLKRWEAGYVSYSIAISRLELDGLAEEIDAHASDAVARGVPAAIVEGVRLSAQILLDQICGPVTLELVALLEAAGEMMPGVRAFSQAAAEQVLTIGDRDRAERNLDRVTSDRFDDWPRSFWWSAFLGTAAMTAARMERRDLCEAAYEKLLPCAGRHVFIGPGFGVPVDTALGAVASASGRHEEARAFFEHALTQCSDMRFDYQRALTEIAYAEALLRGRSPTAPDEERATELLVGAHRRTMSAGGHALAARAEHVLATVRAR